MKFRRSFPYVFLLLSIIIAPAWLSAGETPSLAARRNALVKLGQQGPSAIPALAEALKDEHPVLQRTAIRLLAHLGEPARPTLQNALSHSDALVRRAALAALCEPLSSKALPYLETGLRDPDLSVRVVAVNLLVAVEPRSEAVNKLLEKARNDTAQVIRETAARALWPFHKETVLLRDRKDWDHEVTVVQTLPLPKTGWRFQTDPAMEGHLKKWFDPAFDDSGWPTIEIEQTWEQQGHAYDGVAWYRGSFELPAQLDHNAVEIHFGAVDECAWVWINGVYVGQHDVGIDGWDRPFALDITSAVRWGQKNQITVRVHDSAAAGGIWKPVRIEILK